MPNKPRVSTIISNFNGARYLPKLLETLRGQRGVEVEIIVVDRNSSDESASILAGWPEVKVVQEPPESGLVTGYDVGAAQASTDLLFFCNEDMWFDPDCLRLLAERIDLSARVFAADPWQWTYDGQTWIHGGTRFRAARLELNAPYPFRRYDFICPLAAGEVVPFGCAGAILIHRTAYRDLGGWDRQFFLDHEDVDLFLRAWQQGWKCVTVPDAKVYHAVNVSNSKTIAAGRQRVSRRRYISGRASLPVLGVKYFSTQYALLQFLLWAGMTFFHLLTFRVERAGWMLSAGRELVNRLPAAVHFRRRHSRMLRDRPGEKWFLAPEFQAQT
jgi:GT2 family glycosyltransferase